MMKNIFRFSPTQIVQNQLGLSQLQQLNPAFTLMHE